MSMADSVLDPEKEAEVHQAAFALYGRNLHWMAFFRHVLGLHGAIRQAFPDRDSRARFEQTQTYAEIQQMLTNLRQRRRPPVPVLEEPTRVITVRLPKSLHDALKAEAHDHRTSMNQLCISKLLQFIDDDLVPNDPQ